MEIIINRVPADLWKIIAGSIRTWYRLCMVSRVVFEYHFKNKHVVEKYYIVEHTTPYESEIGFRIDYTTTLMNKCHSLNGRPAHIRYHNGTKYIWETLTWYKYGKRHNDNDYACITYHNNKITGVYYLNDERVFAIWFHFIKLKSRLRQYLISKWKLY